MTKLSPKKKEGKKRISFNFYETAHLYELSMEHMCQNWQNCATCSILRAKLDKFLGPKEVSAIKRILKKNGYCNKLKPEKPWFSTTKSK